MPELPAGTVTLLFTDIEGSTRLLNGLGERYASLLEEHRRVLRDAFSAHGGIEVDTQGDAFFYAFGRAQDAVAGAVAGQRALSSGRLGEDVEVRVRMGLHTGEPGQTQEGYVGPGRASSLPDLFGRVGRADRGLFRNRSSHLWS